MIHKTGGKEPYLSTNTKYIQHPMSNDVGEELLKILGENHSLKHQLEEVILIRGVFDCYCVTAC